jgi:hypothetical protein
MKKKISPNPARDADTKNYVVGLQKYNKQNNIDEEKKAHPLEVHELSIIINSCMILLLAVKLLNKGKLDRESKLVILFKAIIKLFKFDK